MKRNSHLSSGSRSIIKIILGTVTAVALVFVLRGIIGGIFSEASVTIQEMKEYFRTSTAALPSYIRERNELLREIGTLKGELAAQSGNQSTIARLIKENEELRMQSGAIPEERILAGVIARPPFVPYDLLVIDRGSEHGVVEGALVYYGQTHGVGIVSNVYKRSSLVTLFSSAGAETTVYIYGPNVFAYAYGEGGGVIRISVPQGIPLAEGDSVVLPSIHQGDLGIIERIESLPSQPEQNAYLTFPIPIQSLRTVSIAKTIVEPQTYEGILPNVEAIKARFKIEVPDTARMESATGTPTTTGDSSE